MTENLFLSLLVSRDPAGVEVPWHCVESKYSTKLCSVRYPALGLSPNAYSKHS